MTSDVNWGGRGQPGVKKPGDQELDQEFGKKKNQELRKIL